MLKNLNGCMRELRSACVSYFHVASQMLTRIKRETNYIPTYCTYVEVPTAPNKISKNIFVQFKCGAKETKRKTANK